jgi:WD40 repeat protein
MSIELSGFLRDAKRFILNCRSIADSSPLQLYSSALIFAPKASIIRNTFQNCIPSWISQQPEVESGWNAVQQTLEGHGDPVNSVAFSQDSKLLASASDDTTVKIWDTSTGSLQQTLEGHSDPVKSVAFSQDSKLLASASDNTTVKIWDASTGSLQQTLEGHGDRVNSVAFSHDSKLLASASDNTIVKIWDASTGSCHQTVAVNTYIKSLSFDSIDSNLLMNSGSIKVDRTRLLTRSEYPQEGRDEGDRQGLGISGSWVTWNTQNLLWLPPDYRAVSYNISPSRSIVANGCSSGKVFIVEFSLANLMQHFGHL